MKRILITIVFSIVAVSAFLGCKKNQQNSEFKDVDRVNIEGLPEERPVADSINFSFAPYPVLISTYDLNLLASIGGQVSSSDREFKIEVDPARTTAESTEYALPSSFVIKAGTATAIIPVTLKRSARIADRSIKLTLKTMPNENFQLGKKASFTYIWTDDVVRPSTWGNGFQNYLGNYSKVKHRLILSSTEFKDLNLIDASKDFAQYDVIMYIASAALAAKNAYNAANPDAPLKNEFGDVIDICRNCK